MEPKRRLRFAIKPIAALVVVSFLVAFASHRRSKLICSDIMITIENAHENHFLSEADILNLLKSTGKTIVGEMLEHIDTRALEQRLGRNRYIVEAQLYSNVKGVLLVHVRLRRPIARLLRPRSADVYIAEDGELMPTSPVFTARTPLISGYAMDSISSVRNIYKLKNGAQLMQMLQYIHDHEFWRAQIAQIDFDAKGRITLYPQITGQRIEFGAPDQLGSKFEKLMIFYRKILPQKGWTRYRRVNLEYENQIIAQ